MRNHGRAGVMVVVGLGLCAAGARGDVYYQAAVDFTVTVDLTPGLATGEFAASLTPMSYSSGQSMTGDLAAMAVTGSSQSGQVIVTPQAFGFSNSLSTAGETHVSAVANDLISSSVGIQYFSLCLDPNHTGTTPATMDLIVTMDWTFSGMVMVDDPAHDWFNYASCGAALLIGDQLGTSTLLYSDGSGTGNFHGTVGPQTLVTHETRYTLVHLDAGVPVTMWLRTDATGIGTTQALPSAPGWVVLMVAAGRRARRG